MINLGERAEPEEARIHVDLNERGTTSAAEEGRDAGKPKPKPESGKMTLSVRLNTNDCRQLKQLADREQRSLNSKIALIVSEWLQQHMPVK